MIEVETGRFTVGVFGTLPGRQGHRRAQAGGAAAESLTILAKDTPEAAALIELLGAAGDRFGLGAIGTVVGRGPLISALSPAARTWQARARRHHAPRRISGARRPDFRGAHRSRRHSGRHPQRAAGADASRSCTHTVAATPQLAPGLGASEQKCRFRIAKAHTSGR